MKDTTRKPDGVLLEPSPAVPPAEEQGRPQEGIVALRQPISDAQLIDVAREYVRAYTTHNGNINDLLTEDAVLFGDNGRTTPRNTVVSFVSDRYRQRPTEYRQHQEEIVRPERLERWGHEDIGPRTDPARPAEMHAGDVFARSASTTAVAAAGDALFHNTLVFMVRPGSDRGSAETDLPLKGAGVQETNTP